MSDTKKKKKELKNWIAATIAILSACMVDSEKYWLFLFVCVFSSAYLIKDVDMGGEGDDS